MNADQIFVRKLFNRSFLHRRIVRVLESPTHMKECSSDGDAQQNVKFLQSSPSISHFKGHLACFWWNRKTVSKPTWVMLLVCLNKWTNLVWNIILQWWSCQFLKSLGRVPDVVRATSSKWFIQLSGIVNRRVPPAWVMTIWYMFLNVAKIMIGALRDKRSHLFDITVVQKRGAWLSVLVLTLSNRLNYAVVPWGTMSKHAFFWAGLERSSQDKQNVRVGSFR